MTTELLSLFWGLVGFLIGRVYVRQVKKRAFLEGFHAGLVKAGKIIEEKLT